MVADCSPVTFGDVARTAPFTFTLDQAHINEAGEVPLDGQKRYAKGLTAPPAGHRTGLLNLDQDLLLAVVQLSFDSWGDEAGSTFGNLESLIIAVRPREGNDKVAVVLAESRGVETVIKHGVMHAGEAAAALFHEPEGGERLGDDGVAGAGAVISFAKFGESQRRGRVARAGHNDAVGEDLQRWFSGWRPRNCGGQRR